MPDRYPELQIRASTMLKSSGPVFLCVSKQPTAHHSSHSVSRRLHSILHSAQAGSKDGLGDPLAADIVKRYQGDFCSNGFAAGVLAYPECRTIQRRTN